MMAAGMRMVAVARGVVMAAVMAATVMAAVVAAVIRMVSVVGRRDNGGARGDSKLETVEVTGLKGSTLAHRALRARSTPPSAIADTHP
jgi:hypothetical protein